MVIYESYRIVHNNIDIFIPMRIRHKKSLHICIIFKEGKNTYIPTLVRFPAFKKSQYKQSENDGHVIISEKENKININQMCEIVMVTKIPFKVLFIYYFNSHE